MHLRSLSASCGLSCGHPAAGQAVSTIGSVSPRVAAIGNGNVAGRGSAGWIGLGSVWSSY